MENHFWCFKFFFFILHYRFWSNAQIVYSMLFLLHIRRNEKEVEIVFFSFWNSIQFLALSWTSLKPKKTYKKWTPFDVKEYCYFLCLLKKIEEKKIKVIEDNGSSQLNGAMEVFRWKKSPNNIFFPFLLLPLSIKKNIYLKRKRSLLLLFFDIY